jgi:hypothetical protein
MARIAVYILVAGALGLCAVISLSLSTSISLLLSSSAASLYQLNGQAQLLQDDVIRMKATTGDTIQQHHMDEPMARSAATKTTTVSSKTANDNESVANNNNNNKQYTRISCDALQQSVRDGTLKDSNEGALHKKHTTTDPPFWISLHNEAVDQVRWGVVRSSTY